MSVIWPIKTQIGVDQVYVVDEGLDLRGKNEVRGSNDRQQR